AGSDRVRRRAVAMAEVVIADDDAEGLAGMLAGLLRAAVAAPAKATLLDAMAGTITIAVTDADVEVGLRFGLGVCRVLSGGIPGSTVRIEAPSDVVLGLATTPLLAGLPSPLTASGRAFHRNVLTRQVRIRGLRHVGLITQLNRLLSLS
ncbi:MAG: hypothetical protein LC640_05810, partial [Frankia sp.]|nr:hypothetical protein [Frankia sp.]